MASDPSAARAGAHLSHPPLAPLPLGIASLFTAALPRIAALRFEEASHEVVARGHACFCFHLPVVSAEQSVCRVCLVPGLPPT
jgi:hypothetical protein